MFALGLAGGFSSVFLGIQQSSFVEPTGECPEEMHNRVQRFYVTVNSRSETHSLKHAFALSTRLIKKKLQL